MRRYEKVSGFFFGLLAAVQLTRLLFRWPVQVASVTVPLWFSALAVVITGVLPPGRSGPRQRRRHARTRLAANER